MTKNQKLIINLLYNISFVSILIGILFLIMHWPFSFQLLTGGFLVNFILRTIRFINLKKRNIIDFVDIILFILFTGIILYQIINNGKINFNSIFVKLIVGFSLINLVIRRVFIIKYELKEKQDSKQKISNYLYNIIGIAIFAGIVFYLLKWQFAFEIISIGIGAALIWIVFELITSQSKK